LFSFNCIASFSRDKKDLPISPTERKIMVIEQSALLPGDKVSVELKKSTSSTDHMLQGPVFGTLLRLSAPNVVDPRMAAWLRQNHSIEARIRQGEFGR